MQKENSYKKEIPEDEILLKEQNEQMLEAELNKTEAELTQEEDYKREAKTVFCRYDEKTGSFVKCETPEEEKQYMYTLKEMYQKQKNGTEDSGMRVMDIIFYNMEKLIYSRIHKCFGVSEKNRNRNDVDKFWECVSYSALALDKLFMEYDPEKSKLSTYLYTNIARQIRKEQFKIEKENGTDTVYHDQRQKEIRKAAEQIEKEYGIENALSRKDDNFIWELARRTGLSEKVIRNELHIINMKRYQDNVIITSEGKEESVFDNTPSDFDMEASMEEKYKQNKLMAAINILNQEEKIICKLYHGLDALKVTLPSYTDPETGEKLSSSDILNRCESNYTEIAKLLNMSQTKVKKIESVARDKLKKKILNDPDFYNYVYHTYKSADISEQMPILLLPDETIIAEYMGMLREIDFSLLTENIEEEWPDEEYEVVIKDLPDILK